MNALYMHRAALATWYALHVGTVDLSHVQVVVDDVDCRASACEEFRVRPKYPQYGFTLWNYTQMTLQYPKHVVYLRTGKEVLRGWVVRFDVPNQTLTVHWDTPQDPHELDPEGFLDLN